MSGIESFIVHYGPLAVFVGAGLEGHTAVIAGGFLAHQRLIPLWTTLLCAIAGSWLVDQLLFLAGRRWRGSRFVTKATAGATFGKALGFIERYPEGYILAFRFLYGLRMVSPLAVGFSKVSAARFFVLNVLGAAIWAGAFTAAGYVFGDAIERWLPDLHWLKRHGVEVLVAVVAVVVAAHLARVVWNSRKP